MASSSPQHERLQRVVQAVYEQQRKNTAGAVASCIPELAGVDPEPFGIALATTTGALITAGDVDCEFTIQSISKAFAFGMALEAHGTEAVYQRVATEPSGNSFNSITFEKETHRPFNPMVNSGAIAITAMLYEAYGDDAFETIRRTFSLLAGRDLSLDEKVYHSEAATGHRNRALAYLMRATGIIKAPAKPVLDLYFRQCSLNVNARDLAVMSASLANLGNNPLTGDSVFSPLHLRHVLSVIFTCGMYDYAGQWAVDVGLPAKSGVGGGLLAVVNRQLGIGLFSPRLDDHGNSIRAIAACVHLAEELGLHAFEFSNAGSSILTAYLEPPGGSGGDDEK